MQYCVCELARAALRLSVVRTCNCNRLSSLLAALLALGPSSKLAEESWAQMGSSTSGKNIAKPGASANAAPSPLSVPLLSRAAVSVTQNHFASCLVSTCTNTGSGNEGGAAGNDQKRDAGAAPPALRERPAGPLAPDVAVVTVRI